MPQEPNSENPESIEKVPMKKIIYIDIDDEITQVYDRIKNLKIQDIYIVVPARAALFQSIVNLKILKRKVQDLGKKISIITNDRIGIHLANQAEIPIFDRMEESHQDRQKVEKILNPKLRISPLKASSNPVVADNPRRLPSKKISIFEIVRRAKYGLGHNKSRLNLLSGKSSSDKSSLSPKKSFVLFPTHRRAMSVLIVLSLIVLLGISYVTLPGATISLTPKSNVIEMSVNITLADSEKNSIELSNHPPHTIASYAISTTIKKTFTYHSSGQIFQGTNATGKITIINELNREWPLVPKTRFQTPEGFVFRSQQFVTVPPATAEGFGTMEVNVVADEFDVFSQVIGERGNIGSSTFFLPGLSESSRKVLYAKSTEPLSGGTTVVIQKVLKEDLQAAEEKAKTEILAQIVPELKNYVQTLNETNHTNLALLSDDVVGEVAIKKGEPRVFIPKDLADKQLETFEVSAEVDAAGVAYNASELLNILKEELKLRKSPEKRLLGVDESSVFYRVFEMNDEIKKIKITATIKGREAYEINPETVNGARFIQKMTESILGKKREEAKDFIQNLPEVNKIEIKTWPVWAPTLPTVVNNIKVEVVNE